MYYYTTTIDEAGMFEVITAVNEQINGLMRKHAPFKIVGKPDMLDEALPDVIVARFYLTITDDINFKNDGQLSSFYSALCEALEQVRQLNEANYIVTAQSVRPARKH